MAHTSSNNNATKARDGDEVKPPKITNSKGAVFHDFLGKGCSATSETFLNPKLGSFNSGGVSKQLKFEASPPVSASIVGGGGGCGGGGGGLGAISATSDLAPEKHGGSHFEGVPYYGPRGVCTGPGLSSRMSRTKRSNSDSFLWSSREMLPSAQHDSLEDSHLTKSLRQVGREQLRRSHDEDTSFGLQHVRPISASQISQHSTGGRIDATSSNWAVPVNIGPELQYPPRAGQAMPFGYLTSQTKSREASAGPSVVVSQGAADEGSRTGIWSSINATAGADERSFSGVLADGTPKSVAHISESEFEDAPSGHGLDSTNRQMTIFYAGQAHVFDNVHPNKANAIMCLAGSSGGSWSTTYAPTLGSRLSSGEHRMPDTENVTRASNGYALARKSLGRSLVRENSMHLPDRIPNSTGIHQVISLTKETKRSNQSMDTRSKEERHDL